jgi:UDP-N-acetylglucosamine--N-acetylmuramyl-(pentapeptide) pyrophosphoryl-undecaprenol N-acetylglucosamine transferase
LAARFAKVIAISHQEAAEFFKNKNVVQTGMPIRRALREPIADPYQVLGISKDRPVILVTGGSSGAERLNNFTLASLPRLLPFYTVIHQVGDANLEAVSSSASALITNKEELSRYYVFGHLPEKSIAAAIQAAALVISRAGSTTLFEIAAAGKPAIIVPIPEDTSRDQRSNAYAYARVTGAVVLEERNLSDDLLVAEIDRILKNPNVLKDMVAGAKSLTASEGAYKLADILISVGKEHE